MDQEKVTFPAVTFDEFPATSYEEWKKEAIVALKGGDFQKRLHTATYEGIELRPIYTKEDVKDIQQTSTFPGAKNFLRGATPGGYMEEKWAMAQNMTTPCPKESNKLLLREIERGANALNVKIGPTGVNIKSAEDVKTLFNGVDLAKVRVQVVCGESALSMLKMMDEALPDFKNARGCVGADPVGALAAIGTISRTKAELQDDMAEAVKFAAEKAPGLRTVLVNGTIYANGGADATLEVACCVSTAAGYIDAMLSRGIDIETAAKSIRFCFSLGSNFFMEIAKIRAARTVWAQIVSAFGGSDEAQKIDVLARTSKFTKTVYDPYVNILRATTEAFSGVVGGIDAMEVAPLDDAYGSSDETNRRIARNIQIMLQEEFNLLSPVDPAGGSYYVETLTAQLANNIWTAFQKLEKEGGVAVSLKSGTIQADIEKVLNERFANLATRSDRAVGTNMYANTLEERLDRPAKTAPVIPANGAETCKPITAHRWTEQFEALREKTEQYEAKTGKTVKIFLANMGPIPQHKARADFACGFFEVGHFEMLRNDGFATPDEAIAAAKASGADVAVICSSDATYPELVPVVASGIKAACPNMSIMMAGAPAAEHKDSYVKAGVEEFIHVRSNCYEILSKIQSARGIC